MADPAARRPENAPGPFFVDRTCIDCDTCRWMAPASFARRGRQSAVTRQPASPAERLAALQAQVACPTASIGSGAPADEVRAAIASFPIPVTGTVSHLGFHSAASFGAAAYLVRMPGGNAMVDCPRYSEPLARRVEGLGGLRWILLTHRDDVADHARWADRFGARRVLHGRDGPLGGGGPEVVLDGGAPVQLAPGLTAIPTPGHTAGHVCYHWAADGGVLFSGDHLAYDDEAGRLEAWPEVCWHDWGAQTRSMELLRGWAFEWVLPGHGRRGHRAGGWDPELGALVAWMGAQR